MSDVLPTSDLIMLIMKILAISFSGQNYDMNLCCFQFGCIKEDNKKKYGSIYRRENDNINPVNALLFLKKNVTVFVVALVMPD